MDQVCLSRQIWIFWIKAAASSDGSGSLATGFRVFSCSPNEDSSRSWLPSISVCSEGLESIRNRLIRRVVSKLERPAPRTLLWTYVASRIACQLGYHGNRHLPSPNPMSARASAAPCVQAVGRMAVPPPRFWACLQSDCHEDPSTLQKIDRLRSYVPSLRSSARHRRNQSWASTCSSSNSDWWKWKCWMKVDCSVL